MAKGFKNKPKKKGKYLEGEAANARAQQEAMRRFSDANSPTYNKFRARVEDSAYAEYTPKTSAEIKAQTDTYLQELTGVLESSDPMVARIERIRAEMAGEFEKFEKDLAHARATGSREKVHQLKEAYLSKLAERLANNRVELKQGTKLNAEQEASYASRFARYITSGINRYNVGSTVSELGSTVAHAGRKGLHWLGNTTQAEIDASQNAINARQSALNAKKQDLANKVAASTSSLPSNVVDRGVAAVDTVTLGASKIYQSFKNYFRYTQDKLDASQEALDQSQAALDRKKARFKAVSKNPELAQELGWQTSYRDSDRDLVEGGVYSKIYDAFEDMLDKSIADTEVLHPDLQLWQEGTLAFSGGDALAQAACKKDLDDLKQEYEYGTDIKDAKGNVLSRQKGLYDLLTSLDNDPNQVLEVQKLQKDYKKKLDDALAKHAGLGVNVTAPTGAAATHGLSIGGSTSTTTASAQVPLAQHLEGHFAAGAAVNLRAEMNQAYMTPKSVLEQWRYELDQKNSGDYDTKTLKAAETFAAAAKTGQTAAVAAIKPVPPLDSVPTPPVVSATVPNLYKTPTSTLDTDLQALSGDQSKLAVLQKTVTAELNVLGKTDTSAFTSTQTDEHQAKLDYLNQAQATYLNPVVATSLNALQTRLENLQTGYLAATPTVTDTQKATELGVLEKGLTALASATVDPGLKSKISATQVELGKLKQYSPATADAMQQHAQAIDDFVKLHTDYAADVRELLNIEHLFSPTEAASRLKDLEETFTGAVEKKKADIVTLTNGSGAAKDELEKQNKELFNKEQTFAAQIQAGIQERQKAEQAFHEFQLKYEWYMLQHDPFDSDRHFVLDDETRKEIEKVDPLKQLEDLKASQDPDATITLGTMKIHKHPDGDGYVLNLSSAFDGKEQQYIYGGVQRPWARVWAWLSEGQVTRDIKDTLHNPYKLDKLGLVLEAIAASKKGKPDENTVSYTFKNYSDNNFNTMLAVYIAADAKGIKYDIDKDFAQSCGGRIDKNAIFFGRVIGKLTPEAKALKLQEMKDLVRQYKDNQHNNTMLNEVCRAVAIHGSQPGAPEDNPIVKRALEEIDNGKDIQKNSVARNFVQGVANLSHFNTSLENRLSVSGNVEEEVKASLQSLRDTNLMMVTAFLPESGATGKAAAYMNVAVDKDNYLALLALKSRELDSMEAQIVGRPNTDSLVKEVQAARKHFKAELSHYDTLAKQAGLGSEKLTAALLAEKVQSIQARNAVAVVKGTEQDFKTLKSGLTKLESQTSAVVDTDAKRADFVKQLKTCSSALYRIEQSRVLERDDNSALKSSGAPIPLTATELLVKSGELSDLKAFAAINFDQRVAELEATKARLEIEKRELPIKKEEAVARHKTLDKSNVEAVNNVLKEIRDIEAAITKNQKERVAHDSVSVSALEDGAAQLKLLQTNLNGVRAAEALAITTRGNDIAACTSLVDLIDDALNQPIEVQFADNKAAADALGTTRAGKFTALLNSTTSTISGLPNPASTTVDQNITDLKTIEAVETNLKEALAKAKAQTADLSTQLLKNAKGPEAIAAAQAKVTLNEAMKTQLTTALGEVNAKKAAVEQAIGVAATAQATATAVAPTAATVQTLARSLRDGPDSTGLTTQLKEIATERGKLDTLLTAATNPAVKKALTGAIKTLDDKREEIVKAVKVEVTAMLATGTKTDGTAVTKTNLENAQAFFNNADLNLTEAEKKPERSLSSMVSTPKSFSDQCQVAIDNVTKANAATAAASAAIPATPAAALAKDLSTASPDGAVQALKDIAVVKTELESKITEIKANPPVNPVVMEQLTTTVEKLDAKRAEIITAAKQEIKAVLDTGKKLGASATDPQMTDAEKKAYLLEAKVFLDNSDIKLTSAEKAAPHGPSSGVVAKFSSAFASDMSTQCTNAINKIDNPPTPPAAPPRPGGSGGE